MLALDELIGVDSPAVLFSELQKLKDAGVGKPGRDASDGSLVMAIEEAVGALSAKDEVASIPILLQHVAAAFETPMSYSELRDVLMDSTPGRGSLGRSIELGEDADSRQGRNIIGMLAERDDLVQRLKSDGTPGVASFLRAIEGLPGGGEVSDQDMIALQQGFAPSMGRGGPGSEEERERQSQLGVTSARNLSELYGEIYRDPEFKELWGAYGHGFNNPRQLAHALLNNRPLPPPRFPQRTTGPRRPVDPEEALDIEDLMSQLKAEESEQPEEPPPPRLSERLNAMVRGDEPTPQEAENIKMFLLGEIAENPAKEKAYKNIIARIMKEVHIAATKQNLRALPLRNPEVGPAPDEVSLVVDLLERRREDSLANDNAGAADYYDKYVTAVEKRSGPPIPQSRGVPLAGVPERGELISTEEIGRQRKSVAKKLMDEWNANRSLAEEQKAAWGDLS